MCNVEENLIIFHFNSWLSFQRLCRLLRGYQFNFVISKPGSNIVLIPTLHSTCAMHKRVEFRLMHTQETDPNRNTNPNRHSNVDIFTRILSTPIKTLYCNNKKMFTEAR